MSKRTKLLSVLFLAVCAVFFFAGGPDVSSTRSAQHAWDLGHAAFFFVATVVWLRWRGWAAAGNPLRQWVLVLLCVTVVGLGIEGIQAGLGRSASVSDMFRNIVGALLGLAFFGSYGRRGRNWVRPVARAAALVLLLAASIPLATAVADEVSAARAFPMLSDFETPFQLSRWESDVSLSLERDTVRLGSGALRVPLSTARYSTASLQFFPGDWSGSSLLAASVFNPEDEPLELVVRVHDRWHDEHGMRYDDRFNRRFVIATGWNDLEVSISDIASAPRERTMDLTSIEGLSFFSVELPRRRTIFIDQVELR